MKQVYSLMLALLLSVLMIKAQDTTAVSDSSDNTEAYFQKLDSLIAAFDYKTGEIKLRDLALVNVPPGFKFLQPIDAQTVLTDVWRNPPDNTVMGMLVPDSVDYYSESSWAVTYSYEEDGHVKDDDAEEIEYDDLLKQMKQDCLDANEERVKEGYSKIELIGWAQSPFYDKATHKLHWAKELKVDEDSIHTLNYNIRMLGRKGVLVMNVIAGIDHLPVVKSNMDALLTSTNFTQGNRYEDFDASIDKVAEYGIGGLVAGAVLVKTGLLAKLGIFLAKAWKFIALGVVAIIGFFRKKFTRNKA
jgi:uncharacterized membrane-anchored protein